MASDLNSNLEALFSKMENFISTKTIVGEPIHIGNVIMLPLVDVAFGVGAGSSDVSNSKGAHAENDTTEKSVGLGGLGAKITPSAVLVIKDDTVQLVNVKNQDSLNKLIDMAPSVLSKLNLGSLFSKGSSNDKGKVDENEVEETEKDKEEDSRDKE